MAEARLRVRHIPLETLRMQAPVQDSSQAAAPAEGNSQAAAPRFAVAAAVQVPWAAGSLRDQVLPLDLPAHTPARREEGPTARGEDPRTLHSTHAVALAIRILRALRANRGGRKQDRGYRRDEQERDTSWTECRMVHGHLLLVTRNDSADGGPVTAADGLELSGNAS
jgi:hypothetical protein